MKTNVDASRTRWLVRTVPLWRPSRLEQSWSAARRRPHGIGADRSRWPAVLLVAGLVLVACSDDGNDANAEADEIVTSSSSTSAPTDVGDSSGHDVAADSAEAGAAEIGAVLATDARSELAGSWHRAQTCEEMRAAFQGAGMAESHVEWLTGNFFDGRPGPTEGDVCEGARGPLEHSHSFTAPGAFGSRDEAGEQVDEGDFEFVDADTLAFPSHAAEFGYDGDLVVSYSIAGDVVTFEVSLPDPCEDACRDAYAWALSAFASGPWTRGEVP